MYEFLFDYVEPDHGEKVNLCYMDASSFTAYTKPNDIWKTCCKLACQIEYLIRLRNLYQSLNYG